MRVLLLDAYRVDDPDRVVVDEAVATLTAGGHEVIHRALVGGPFESFLSQAEREAYHSDTPLVTIETRDEAAVLAGVDALLFCYPTSLFTVPAVLKSWLERVLVPGVAFVFDARNRVRPGMGNVRRLGSITTTGHSAAATRRARDAGRRTTTWNIRMSCHRFCRRSVVSLETGAPDRVAVRKVLARW